MTAAAPVAASGPALLGVLDTLSPHPRGRSPAWHHRVADSIVVGI